TFDLDAADSRRDLVAALRLLMELRALTQVDGDEERFLRQREQEVLYDVHHLILYRLLAARRSPSSILEKDWGARLAPLVAEPVIDEADQRNQRIRHHLNRRLLDDPVLYTPGDLPPDTLDYLLKQRPHLIKALVDATGLEPEDRKDGIALSDRTGDCTDLGLPEEGTDGHATLLTAEFLGAQRLTAEPGEIVPISMVERFLAEQAVKNKGFWRKETAAQGAEEALAREVLRRLASLDLVRHVQGGVIVMAAIHRYRHELKPRVTES
ncbi:MAG: TIGR02678 family protein, partial [Prosthecobacter sp.]|nr:TIGR02678 family protein [Prosthecobacter sp.]